MEKIQIVENKYNSKYVSLKLIFFIETKIPIVEKILTIKIGIINIGL